MTDESRGIEAVGPPWSVDLLADLHAGVLDDHEAAQLWPRVQADPEARAIIEALEATTTDLASLATAPAPPMPAEVASRIDDALAQEARGATGVAPVVDLAAARRKRNQRIGWISGVVAVAAAAVAAIAIVVPGSGETTGTPVAAPPPSAQPGGSALAVRSDQPQAAVGRLSTGVKDYGPLGNAQRLSSCLQEAGFAPTASPIGVRPGTLDGQPAVLALLTTGKLAEFRLVALSPECGLKPLLDQVVGR
ncbi:hypothetical protein LWP59_40200 [Amycolatopsis acidiphila]|uniref:Anti-sigma factor n=1 Tax=Amycolatopsis acidiphila TaxID=715473 RepID=A0A558A2B4_9PSEU|nr:hypothetical protein [Amycolatopsis acidiphila]TVT18399.1 hypothetical protein FNH06_27855 [Amycolatopsis acidiphila]UIJ60120.1 hypothetical protein LWP59_40200 [Amycolatopsis acidiphila]GHG61259.1 hypothetical protein GCM10017788_15750 [Amycolatopsis acidiphila]